MVCVSACVFVCARSHNKSQRGHFWEEKHGSYLFLGNSPAENVIWKCSCWTEKKEDNEKIQLKLSPTGTLGVKVQFNYLQLSGTMSALPQRILWECPNVDSLLLCLRFWEIVGGKKGIVPIWALLHICGWFSVTNESIRNKQPSKYLFLPPFKPASRVQVYWKWRTCSCSAAQLHRSTDHYWALSASSKNVAASPKSGFHTFKPPFLSPPFPIYNYWHGNTLFWLEKLLEIWLTTKQKCGTGDTAGFVNV